MASTAPSHYTYADLESFPEDNFRRELIDGELIVSAAPRPRHQRAVLALARALADYEDVHGGQTYPAPTDVYFSDINVVEPDVLFVRADHLAQIEEKYVRSAPDVVVEVSSPSSRRLDLSRKRDLYSRFGVAEYWFVDLDADRVEVYRLVNGAYGLPEFVTCGQTLHSSVLPEFSIEVNRIFGL